MEKPKWAAEHGLQLCGNYFEGFIDDCETVLSQHKIETVTSYGVRRSRQNVACSYNHLDGKENNDINLKSPTEKVHIL